MLLGIPIEVPAAWDRDGAADVSLPAKVLVANRGEIAVRIMRTLRRLGIASVVVHHAEDAGSLAVREADEAVELFGDTPVGAYLDIEADRRGLHRHRRRGAASGLRLPLRERRLRRGGGRRRRDVHRAAGGRDARDGRQDRPPSGSPRRRACRSLPGSDGAVGTPRRRSPRPTGSAIPCWSRRAPAAAARACGSPRTPTALPRGVRPRVERGAGRFGDGRVFVERYIERPRHIEVQVLARRARQRRASRRARVLDPAPLPEGHRGVPVAVRRRRHARARWARRRWRWRARSATSRPGTVELIADADGGFYFLEMNTRLQVEHPVTELVTGIDIVAEQIRDRGRRAARLRPGRRSGWTATRSSAASTRRTPTPGSCPRPAACSSCASRPAPGSASTTASPRASDISASFDPMIAKLAVHGPTRDEAIWRAAARRCARPCCSGTVTNTAFLERVLAHPAFAAGRHPHRLPRRARGRAARRRRPTRPTSAAWSPRPRSPAPASTCGSPRPSRSRRWATGGADPMAYELTLADDEAASGRRHPPRRPGDGHASTGARYHGSLRPLGDAYELTLDDRRARMWIVVDRDTIHVHAFGRAWTLEIVDPVERARAGGPGGRRGGGADAGHRDHRGGRAAGDRGQRGPAAARDREHEDAERDRRARATASSTPCSSPSATRSTAARRSSPWRRSPTEDEAPDATARDPRRHDLGELPDLPRAQPRARRRAARDAAPRPPRAAAARARPPRRAGQAARPRAPRPAARSRRRRSSSCCRWRPTGTTTARRRRRCSSPASASSAAAR